MLKDKINELLELYMEVAKNYLSAETESAPSGEWEEYNHEYILLQSDYFLLQQVLEIFEIKIISEGFVENGEFEINFECKLIEG